MSGMGRPKHLNKRGLAWSLLIIIFLILLALAGRGAPL